MNALLRESQSGTNTFAADGNVAVAATESHAVCIPHTIEDGAIMSYRKEHVRADRAFMPVTLAPAGHSHGTPLQFATARHAYSRPGTVPRETEPPPQHSMMSAAFGTWDRWLDGPEPERPARMTGGLTDTPRSQARQLADDERVRAAAHAARMQALGQIAGGIAHDFNNVLQVIADASALIEGRSDDSEAVMRFSRIVAHAAARGSSITQRLLAFVRRDELRVAVVDAVAVLSDIKEILAHTLGGGIEVRTDAQRQESQAPILVDRAQLETVLVNLATNARDAMPGGGVLTLSVRMSDLAQPCRGCSGGLPHGLPTGGYVVVSVADTGHGMDPAILARVTEPFFTTKCAGKGTGLGLSMAKDFAEQSGGALSITSEAGQGTVVSLWLPQAPSRPVAGPTSNETPENRVGSLTRVLLVDDDDMVREPMQEILSEFGLNVVAAADGTEALALLEASSGFDILVTDLSMPRMDGLTLTGAVHERAPGLPVILLTGLSEDEELDHIEARNVCVLRKPISSTRLADEIARMVGASIEA